MSLAFTAFSWLKSAHYVPVLQYTFSVAGGRRGKGPNTKTAPRKSSEANRTEGEIVGDAPEGRVRATNAAEGKSQRLWPGEGAQRLLEKEGSEPRMGPREKSEA
jgi:hypothetical protein